METLGLSQLGPVGQADAAGGLTAFRTAPERLLIRTEDDSVFDQARDAVDESALCLLDLSHARTVIRLEGPEARNLLARLVSVDLRDDVMPVNGFALTGIHGVSVMLHRVTAAALPIYDLYIPYTWAASLWDLTCQAALPLGYEVASGARQGT